MELSKSIISNPIFWTTFISFILYLYLKYVHYNFWRRKGIPQDSPSILLGNIPLDFVQGKTTLGKVIHDSYLKNRKHRFHGLYVIYKPVLVINDPDLIHLVLIKNFHNFYNRGTLYNESKDPLSTSLVRLYDEKWKRLRSKLSPTFTSGKLKLMYPLIKEISDQLIDVFDDCLKKSNVIEVKDLITRFTIDCISTIAFGFNCDSLHKPQNDFLKYGKISNNFGKFFIILSFFLNELAIFYPLPRKRKEVAKFFFDIFKNMVDYRKKENIVRHDFLNLLMQLMDQGEVENDNVTKSNQSSSDAKKNIDKITLTEALGQSVFFFAAGQETTATTIVGTLYELALNQDIQEKLYREIIEVTETCETLTYEKLFSMEYLDMVYNETLRKHPGSPMLNRMCSEDFDIPNSNYRIKKGDRVVISIKGVHMNPDVYPEPEKFDPTRFSPENKAKHHPCTFIPFGEGPRQCIGKRLGILKPKIALFYLFLNYKFSVCDKTPIPIKYMSDYFVQVFDGDIYLKVEKRSHNTRK